MARLLSHNLVPCLDPDGWDYGSHRMFALLRFDFQCERFIGFITRLGHPGADALQGMVADDCATALATFRVRMVRLRGSYAVASGCCRPVAPCRVGVCRRPAPLYLF